MARPSAAAAAAAGGGCRRAPPPPGSDFVVCAVTPTCAARRGLHAALLGTFRRQTYTNKRLFVVDDQDEGQEGGEGGVGGRGTPRRTPPSPLQDAALLDERITYVRRAGLSVGGKRNLAVRLCPEGALCLHLDDDDVYSDLYMARMAERLGAEAGVALVKLSAWLWFDLNAQALGRFDGAQDGDHSRLWGYGFSYAYWRDAVLEVGGFPDADFGEDFALVMRLLAAGRRARHFRDAPRAPLVVHLLHGTNSSGAFATQTLPPEWLDGLMGGHARARAESVRRALFRAAMPPLERGGGVAHVAG